MKILCLHQFGSSGLIFEKQLAGLIDLLSPTYEFVYINGPCMTPRPKAIPELVKGPFYCWYEGLASESVKEAHEIVQETIEEEGPFDGVFGFSQGASVAISMLLHQEMHNPDKPFPFKFAIFFCPVVVISPDPNFRAKEIEKYSRFYKEGFSVAGPKDGTTSESTEAIADVNNTTTTTHGEDDATDDEIGDDDGDDDDGDYENSTDGSAKATDEKLHGNVSKDKASKLKKPSKHRVMLLADRNKKALAEELMQLTRDMLSHLPSELKDKWSKDIVNMNNMKRHQDFPRFMHPLTLKQRIGIPTVFIVGKSDPFLRASELAVRLGDKKKTKTVYFQGGHGIPVNPSDVRAIVSNIEWAVQKSMLM